MKDESQFIAGYLSAVQNLVSGYGMERMAAFLMLEAGFSKEQWEFAQKESGFENEKMKRVIDDFSALLRAKQ